MPTSSHNCVVCSKQTTFFNYGVYACNACVLFFRRTLSGVNPSKDCENGGNCDGMNRVIKCKHCRFVKCLTVGMKHESLKNAVAVVSFEKHEELTLLVNRLIILDSHRKSLFLLFKAHNDPTFEEIVEGSNAIEYTPRLENQPMSSFDWGFNQQVTTIEFMKNLEIAKMLSSDDLKALIKASFFKTSILYNAFRSFNGKCEKMVFPDGSDCLPEELRLLCPKLLSRIRSRLIGKFIELRITGEEFLLLLVLFLLANPAIQCLSEEGKEAVNSQRQTFTSALFQYCLIKYQKAGPSRFAELLSVCQVLAKTVEDFHSLAVITMLNGPVSLPKKLFAMN